MKIEDKSNMKMKVLLIRKNFNPLRLFQNSKTGIDLQGKSDRPKKD